MPALKAKIDTGARTSALHAFELHTFTERGARWVRFGLHPLRHNPLALTCLAEVTDYRTVSDSGGHREKRYVISTDIALGGQRWEAEITLTNRENMLFRMLLGRTAMAQRFLVDPQRSYLAGRRLRRAYASSQTPTNAPPEETSKP